MADNYVKLFTGNALRRTIGYLTSYNMATQTVALDVAANDLQTSGGGACMINGQFIPALAADDAFDISADSVGDAVGVSLADDEEVYTLVCAKADGTLELFLAGDIAAIGTATLEIPNFDSDIYCALATMLIANDSGSPIVIGTTVLTGDVTITQLTGPVFPHIDKLDKN